MSNKTDVVLLIDRSGSMGPIRAATVESVNKFIDDVRKEPGDGYWTLALFDDQASARGDGEDFPKIVYERLPDSEIRPFTMQDFVPRGGTALIDAVCKTLETMKSVILAQPEESRSRVMIVIVTDGQENQSVEYSSARMRELIGEAEGKLGWQFTFLGANQDVFAETAKMGMATVERTCGGIVLQNKIAYEHDSQGMLGGMRLASSNVRGWKAEGNDTAEGLLSSVSPDFSSTPNSSVGIVATGSDVDALNLAKKAVDGAA